MNETNNLFSHVSSHILAQTHAGGTLISTVSLPTSSPGEIPDYETCLFFASGESEIVATYGSEEAAHQGHEYWYDLCVKIRSE